MPLPRPAVRPSLILAACVAALLPSCSSTVLRSSPVAAPATTASAVYALPKSLVDLEVKLKNNKLTIEAHEVRSVADETARFALDHVTDSFGSDELTIELSSDGMLKAIDSKTTDTTKEVLVALVDTLAEAAKIGVPASAAGAPAGSFSVRMWIDPCSAADITAFDTLLTAHGASLSRSLPASFGTATPPTTFDGVHHRAKISVVLTATAGSETVSIPVSVVDSRSMHSTPITRGNFIEKSTKLTFDDGVLTKVVVDAPSEALGLVTIPLDVAKALVAVPAELFSGFSDEVSTTVTTTTPPASDG